MRRLLPYLVIALPLLACSDDAPNEPNIDEPLTLDVFLAMDYEESPSAPNDYSVTALPGAESIIVSGAIHVPNGGYLPSAQAQLNSNNELDLTMTFRDFGGVDIPFRVGYQAVISPLTSGSYVLSVTHHRDGGGTVLTTPIVGEVVIIP